MSDTPRTDTLLVVHDLDPKPRTLIEHARQLERELAAANRKIQRLIAAGDAMAKDILKDWDETRVTNDWTAAKEEKA